MSRVKINHSVIDQFGRAVTGAVVQVNLRDTSTAAAVYLNSTGTTQVANPITSVVGEIDGWLDAGYSYDLVITSPDGRVSHTERLEAVSAAGNVPAGSVPVFVQSVRPTNVVGTALWLDTSDGDITFTVITGP